MTKARFPTGTTMEYSLDPSAATPVWVKIDEVTSVAFPEQTNERSDVTNFDTPEFQQENIVGVTTNADIVCEANWTGSAAQKDLFDAFKARTTLGWRTIVPNLVTVGDSSGIQAEYDGQLARCTVNNLTPRDPMKLLLSIVCNAPTIGDPAVAGP